MYINMCCNINPFSDWFWES